MNDNYKIETKEELIDKINEELDMLEGIYDGEGIVLKRAEEIPVSDEDVSTNNSGQDAENDESPITQFQAQIELDIQPSTGFDKAKVGLMTHIRIVFDQFYPQKAPKIQFLNKKGLDQEQFEDILKQFNEEMKVLVNARNEDEDESGFLYDLHEKMRDILTKYNDTVEGRCAVCLENFTVEGEEEESKSFTERVDLVRIDQCFHRFHMICVHRDWFMPRKNATDHYGDVLHYEIPEEKRCPICRREVDEQEVKYVQQQKSSHPEIDDGGYSQ